MHVQIHTYTYITHTHAHIRTCSNEEGEMTEHVPLSELRRSLGSVVIEPCAP